MAEAHVDNRSFKCLICLHECNTPRQLPCFHTFCTGCLDTYINSEYVTEDNRTYFPCPVCESPCYRHDKNAPVSSWAGSFPRNQLFASSTFKETESGQTFCHGCLTDDEENVASFWCKACSEALCQPCRVAHRRSKLLSTHKVIAIDEVSKTDIRMPVSIVNTCPRHTGKTIEVYCHNHNALCCVLCVTLSHRMCTQVSSLEDTTMMFSLDLIECELGKMKDESKTIVEEDENKLTTLEDDYQKMTSNMAMMIKKAKDKMGDLHQRFQTGLDVTYRRHRESLHERLRTNRIFQANIENTNQLMRVVKEKNPVVDIFIVTEQSKTQLLSHVRRLQQKTGDKHNTFELKIRYDDVLEKVNNVMTTVGRLEVSSSLSSSSQDSLTSIRQIIDTLHTTSSVTSFSESTSSSDMLSDVGHVAVPSSSIAPRIDVWTGSLSLVKSVHKGSIGGLVTPWLTGGVFIEGEGLLATDYNNKKLLLFDDSYEYLRHYDMDNSPIDITRGFEPNQLLMTQTNGSIIRCTFRDGVLTTVDSIRSYPSQWGIDTLGDNVLIGTDYSVKISTSDFKQVSSIPNLSYSTYVAASTRGLLCHRDEDVIVCRSRDGTEVFRHMCKGIKQPRGIVVDQDGNVYVCGMKSGDIHLISHDGFKDRILLPRMSGITQPFAVVLHPTRQEIIVTSRRENVAFEVYKFCDQ
ncbi:E3 ubiquitin-protein ligase Midline-1-like [Pecten maximus]|uniref:E3 ubiquitin-protein ligase Midline-1-like n=1 Tax=Pecten maximus TaxID=6579 RepID=UPI001458C696|nr:E3 ubiquitin-protein ligase Midline-1-like [Pecten maximus]